MKLPLPPPLIARDHSGNSTTIRFINMRTALRKFKAWGLALVVVNLFLVSTVLGQTTIASQDFESVPATPTLTFTTTGTGANSTGTNGASGKPANANLFASGARGWQATGTTSTLTFANQSLTGFSSYSLNFKLAGMSINSGNGIDAGDITTVSISTNGGTSYSS